MKSVGKFWKKQRAAPDHEILHGNYQQFPDLLSCTFYMQYVPCKFTSSCTLGFRTVILPQNMIPKYILFRNNHLQFITNELLRFICQCNCYIITRKVYQLRTIEIPVELLRKTILCIVFELIHCSCNLSNLVHILYTVFKNGKFLHSY